MDMTKLIDVDFLNKELPFEYQNNFDQIDYDHFITIASIKTRALLKNKYYDVDTNQYIEIDSGHPIYLVQALTASIAARDIVRYVLQGSRVSTGGTVKMYGLTLQTTGGPEGLSEYLGIFDKKINEYISIISPEQTILLHAGGNFLDNFKVDDYLNSKELYSVENQYDNISN